MLVRNYVKYLSVGQILMYSTTMKDIFKKKQYDLKIILVKIIMLDLGMVLT
jgi:hypothetical protein